MTSLSKLTMSTRTPWQITKSVWWALYVRETLQRTMSDRLGWFWLFFQPILIILVIVIIRFYAMQRVRTIDGADFIPWIIVGLIAFQVFRETMLRSMGAIDANRQLFSYRQVKPIDPVFIRCFVEGNLNSFIFLLFILSSLLMEFSLIPHNPAGALLVWISLWLMGVGCGLILSVSTVIFPETKKIVPVSMMPLFLLSGVIFPINFVPPQLIEYLLYNPVLHGIEIIRSLFFESYNPVKGVSYIYFYNWVFGVLVLGLILQLRYEKRMKVL